MKKESNVIIPKVGRLVLWTTIFTVFIVFVYLLSSGKLFIKSGLPGEALALTTFIGGLLGSLLIEKYRRIGWSPYISIETWEDNDTLQHKFQNGNINYRLRVSNIGNDVAKNCLVKISIEKFTKDCIEDCLLSEEDCLQEFGNSYPFIKNAHEFAEIVDEHLLWDIQLHGIRQMAIDIPPGLSYLITIARFRQRGWYLEILSENPKHPRVWLKIRSDNNDNGHIEEYKLKLVVCGDNFSSTPVNVALESPPCRNEKSIISVPLLKRIREINKAIGEKHVVN